MLRCDADAMRTNRNRLEPVETDKNQKDPIRTGTIGHDDMKITEIRTDYYVVKRYIYINIYIYIYSASFLQNRCIS